MFSPHSQLNKRSRSIGQFGENADEIQESFYPDDHDTANNTSYHHGIRGPTFSGPGRYKRGRTHHYGNGGGQRRLANQNSPHTQSFHPRQHHYHSHPQNKENKLAPETTLGSLIFLIGDKSNSPIEENLKHLANVILQDYETFTNAIINSLIDCVSEMSWKVSIYSTLFGLIHVNNPSITKDILISMQENLYTFFRSGHFHKSVNLFRFLADLVNVGVISPSSWINFLQPLLERISVTSSSSSKCAKNESYFYLYLILSSLPWNGHILNQSVPNELNQIIRMSESLINTFKNDINFLYFENSQNISFRKPEVINLFEKILTFRDAHWKEQILVRLYQYFDEFTSDSKKPLDLQPLKLDVVNLPRNCLGSLRFVFSLDLQSISDSDPDGYYPKDDRIEKWIILDSVSQLIFFAQKNHRKCIEYLDTFSFAKKVNLLRALAEVLLSELLRTPKPEHLPVYYAVLIIDALQMHAAKFAKHLGEAVHKIFYHLGSLSHSQLMLFSEWFSHHLSNFDWKWKWETWESSLRKCLSEPYADSDDIDNNSSSPSGPMIYDARQTILWIRDCLMKLTRLSYHERIKAIVTPYFHQWMPPYPDPNFKYALEDASDLLSSNESLEMEWRKHVKLLAKKLCMAIRARESTESILLILGNVNGCEDSQQYLDSNIIWSHSDSSEVMEILKRDIFFQCLLFVGSKSFSHALNVIERYLPILQQMNSTADERVQTIRIIADFWQFNSQFLCTILEKLSSYQVLDPVSILTWAFLEENKELLYSSWIWSLLTHELRRSSSLVYKEKETTKIVESEDFLAQLIGHLITSLIHVSNSMDDTQFHFVYRHPSFDYMQKLVLENYIESQKALESILISVAEKVEITNKKRLDRMMHYFNNLLNSSI